MESVIKPDIEIRKIKPDELLAAIMFRGQYLLGKAPSYDSEISAIDKSLETLHIGAWDDNELVGYVRFERWPQDVFFISRMVVHPTYQKMGIGRKLLDFGHAHADSSGRNSFRLDARSLATGFYGKMGYVSDNSRLAASSNDVAMIRATPPGSSADGIIAH